MFSIIDSGATRGKGHILIVEDEPSVRRVLRLLLETEGYQVSEAENGPTGLALLQQEAPDLVILDVMMPGMDGFTVCRKIREQRRFQKLPVIFLTAKDADESRIMSLDHGANDFLTKPYNSKELLLRVRNHINTSIGQRDANPLTGLPGNTVIEMELRSRLDRHQDFAMVYIDLDNFKAYNDTYSYRAGDRVLQHTVELLEQAIDNHGNKGDFLGHIGGDDFVAITTLDTADAVCNVFKNAFDATILDHYDPVVERVEVPRLLSDTASEHPTRTSTSPATTQGGSVPQPPQLPSADAGLNSTRSLSPKTSSNPRQC